MYEAHPFAAKFRRLPDDEMQALADDIRRNGQAEPAIVWNGQLIDGINRQLACERIGVALQVRAFEGTEEEAVDRIVSANLLRRHDEPRMRAALVLSAEEYVGALRKRAKENSLAQLKTGPVVSGDPIGGDGRVREQLAAKAGVGAATVQRVASLRTADPEQFEQLVRGERPEAPKRSANGGIEAPADIGVYHQRRYAAAKLRTDQLVLGLGSFTNGLAEFDLQYLTCTAEEMAAMVKTLDTAVKQIRAFKARLQGMETR